MDYYVFEKLRRNKGVSVAEVCRNTGIAPATITDWKHGRTTPKADKMKKLADYFGVSVDYMFTGSIKDDMVREEVVPYYALEETAEIAQAMFDRPELKTLFDASRKLSPDDIKAVQTMVDALWRKEQNDD